MTQPTFAAHKAAGHIDAQTTRNLILAAQGFRAQNMLARQEAQPAPQQLADMVRALGLIQVDSVNVFARAHLLPLFSRLGAYDIKDFEAQWHGKDPDGRPFVEAWAHVASLIPVELFPAFGFIREQYRSSAFALSDGVPAAKSPIMAQVRETLSGLGPCTAREVAAHCGHAKTVRPADGWGWSDTRRALEWLYFTGEVIASGRVGNFEKQYGLTASNLDARWQQPLSEEQGRLALTQQALKTLGVGTVACLSDFYRRPKKSVARDLQVLVEQGVAVPLESETLGKVFAHRPRIEHEPAQAVGSALLSPFDPLVFERARTEAAFNFHYRIEIYVPEAKRKYGYYVLPLLHNGRIQARVDLRADRKTATLEVLSCYVEPDADKDLADALAAELRLAARWQQLTQMRVTNRGNGAKALLGALGARSFTQTVKFGP